MIEIPFYFVMKNSEVRDKIKKCTITWLIYVNTSFDFMSKTISNSFEFHMIFHIALSKKYNLDSHFFFKVRNSH